MNGLSKISHEFWWFLRPGNGYIWINCAVSLFLYIWKFSLFHSKSLKTKKEYKRNKGKAISKIQQLFILSSADFSAEILSIMIRGEFKCTILRIHWKLKDQQLETILCKYWLLYQKLMATENWKSTRDTQTKKKSKHNTKIRQQITRKNNKRRKK